MRQRVSIDSRVFVSSRIWEADFYDLGRSVGQSSNQSITQLSLQPVILAGSFFDCLMDTRQWGAGEPGSIQFPLQLFPSSMVGVPPER